MPLYVLKSPAIVAVKLIYMPAKELKITVVGFSKSGQFQALGQLFIGFISINTTHHYIDLGGR